jgi:hypothetical protein
LQDAARYLENNRSRMNYPRYHREGLSGAVRRQAAQVGWDAAEQQLAIRDAGKGFWKIVNVKPFPW